MYYWQMILTIGNERILGRTFCEGRVEDAVKACRDYNTIAKENGFNAIASIELHYQD